MTDPLGGLADSALEHAAADAAGGLAHGHPGAPHDTVCLNCGTVLQGDFCHVCGQSGESLRRPFWSLLGESLETLLSIDGRIARTLPPLMLQPGRMTRAYLDGQRTRFIPPFRLYVLASLVFFVLVPLFTGQAVSILPKGAQDFESARAEIEQSHMDGDMDDEEYAAAVKGLDEAEAVWKAGIPGLVTPQPPGEEGAEPAEPDKEWAGFIPREALDSIREAGENGDRESARFAEVMDEPGRLAQQTMRWIPRMMFVLVPAYAALLGLVYLWRRQFLYFDHLIVSLHFHSAMFFAMAAGVLAAMLVGYGWVTLALLVYSNVYLYRLQRVTYGRGRLSSVLRTLALDSVYFGILMSGLLMAVILGALSL